MKSPRFAGLVLILGACWAATAAAAATPSVEATLTFKGEARKLDHVLVVRAGNEEGLQEGARLRILLSDREFPLRFAAGATLLTAKAYARHAGINAVVVLADPAGRDRGAQLSLLNVTGTEEPAFATASDTAAFSELTVGNEHASGALVFRGALGLEARFSAPIAATPVTADLQGAAALDSAAVKALAAYREALAKSDMAALAQCTTAAHFQEINDFRAKAGDKAFRAAVQGETGGPPLAKLVQRVIVRGDSASVLLQGGEIAELVQEGGRWKVN